MTPLRTEAPAKINLSLAVTGRRRDGFHELITDMVLLQLADRLLLMPGSSGLRVVGDTAAGVPLDETNLAWRGLQAALGQVPELVCLTLEKRIPVQAGLGGGSSDAAAAWRLGRWLQHGEARPADAATLETLGTIGADVPFFGAELAAARVSGIGERVEAAAPPATRHVVLAHPPFRLSTAAVFGELRPAEWSATPEPGRNDLQAAATRLRPEISDVLRLVAGAGGEPHLSGSGPTVYAMSDDPERAAAIAGRLERGGLRATLTRLRDEPASIEQVGEVDPDEAEARE
ncbi:MAG TPA: 4-(cytidine 5'-diphospho)-2-C-methyl-D-erythritol kinase [Candidatus Limnocylindria bacterium]|jgi:4-diphosphocytidyl-2-C-methyl-D-erythritol kinase